MKKKLSILIVLVSSVISCLLIYNNALNDKNVSVTNDKNVSVSAESENKTTVKNCKFDEINDWSFYLNGIGYKYVVATLTSEAVENTIDVVNKDGKHFKLEKFGEGLNNKDMCTNDKTRIFLTISNSDSKWADDYVPSNDDIRNYLKVNFDKLSYSEISGGKKIDNQLQTKELKVDGNSGVELYLISGGYKYFKVPISNAVPNTLKVQKSDSKPLILKAIGLSLPSADMCANDDENAYFTISNTDSKWDDKYIPTDDDIKKYFNEFPYKITYTISKETKKINTKEKLLDGSVVWKFYLDSKGYKYVSANIENAVPNTAKVTKSDSKDLVRRPVGLGLPNGDMCANDDKSIYITINNSDSKWGEAYIPTTAEIKDYFKNHPYKLTYRLSK